MDGQRLVAVIEPMDRAVGERKMRDAAEKNGGDAMAIEIKRGDCRHVGSEFLRQVRPSLRKTAAFSTAIFPGC